VISEDRFALVLDANGTMLRVTNVQNLKPQQFAILGWEVTDIDEAVSHLNQRGGSLRELWHGGAGSAGYLEFARRRSRRVVQGP
jgi:hypothetical protein